MLLDLTCDRLHTDGAWPVPSAVAMRRYVLGELGYFRQRGRPVFHVLTRGAAGEGGVNAEVPPHHLAGTPGAEFDEAFAPRAGEQVIEKQLDSAFAGTDLAAQLAALDVAQLTLVGVETHAGILATFVDAAGQGFHVIVPDTCVASSQPALHESALRLIRETRWLRGRSEPPGTGH